MEKPPSYDDPRSGGFSEPNQYGTQPYPTQPNQYQYGMQPPPNQYGMQPPPMQPNQQPQPAQVTIGKFNHFSLIHFFIPALISFISVQQGPRQSPRLGRVPVSMTCYSCQAQITTSIRTETGMLQYIAAAGICFFGCWLGCCLIPFCVDDWRDTTHYCPSCNSVLGHYRNGF